MKPAPLPPVAAAMRRMGYKLDGRELVPNLVGVRSTPIHLDPLDEGVDPFGSLTNKWDDYLGVIYFDGKVWHEHLFTATTDPGNLSSFPARGTAVMKPGQYLDAYTLGVHRKGTDYAHDAIVNWGLTAPDYWRVRRRGGQLEVESENDEYIGLNIHRARSGNHAPPATVGPYSAGCQVMRNIEDWTWFLQQVEHLHTYAKAAHALDYMNYTLLMLSDVTDAPVPQLMGNGAALDTIPKEEG